MNVKNILFKIGSYFLCGAICIIATLIICSSLNSARVDSESANYKNTIAQLSSENTGFRIAIGEYQRYLETSIGNAQQTASEAATDLRQAISGIDDLIKRAPTLQNGN